MMRATQTNYFDTTNQAGLTDCINDLITAGTMWAGGKCYLEANNAITLGVQILKLKAGKGETPANQSQSVDNFRGDSDSLIHDPTYFDKKE